MSNDVTLSVRSQLLTIVDELKKIGEESNKTSDGLNNFAKKVGDTQHSQIKSTETFLGRLRSLTSSVAKNMADDFKALFSIGGMVQGLKLGGMFQTNIKETFALSDTIRKLANVFGIAENRFVGFQQKLTTGLGEIGLSSEAAINSLKGLSETQVRGEENLADYAKLSGQLASISGQAGQEGTISKGIAGVITARGGDVNDPMRFKSVAEDLKKAFTATGASPTQVLGQLEQIIARMPQDLRKSISTKGLINLGTTAAIAGPNSTKFLEEYLSKSSIARKAMEARGFGGVFTNQGIDTAKFRKAAGSVIGNFKDDPRLMAQTLGLSEDAAEGFVRLYESLDKVDKAQAKMSADNKQLSQQYYESMTASEAFNASLNKLKASLAKPLAVTTNFIISGLQKAFKTSLDDLINLLPKDMADTLKSGKNKVKEYLPKALNENIGSTAVVAGGATLAALLTGGGLKGLLSFGKSKATGVAERAAYEGITGEKIQPVYVVNAKEIGESSSGGSAGGGLFGDILKVSGAAGIGYAAGTALQEFEPVKNVLDKIENYLANLVGSASTPNAIPYRSKETNVRVQIESKTKDIKMTPVNSRGAFQ